MQRAYGLILLTAIILAGGCASRKPEQVRYERVSGWQWQDIHGRAIETEHYVLHTTLVDDDMVQRFARLMEAAWAQYASLAPQLKPADRKLPLFIFETYDQWARYTLSTTGDDAPAYLSVLNGGYAVGDRFVCWVSNETDAQTTAAHEGLHQFIARNFRMRLPPTLEEGLASTLETVTVRPDGVRFDPARNVRRQAALRDAIAGNYLIPLDTLLLLHAGDLQGRDQPVRETYYAQAWALAVMLRTNPSYQAGFLSMMNAAATGNTPIDVGRNDGSQVYYPAKIQPFLQRYVAPDWAKFQADYREALHDLAARPEADPTF